MSDLIIVGDVGEARTPKYRCLICKARGERSVFYEGEERAYERHVARCYDANEAELRMQSMREKAPGLFDPNRSGDVELGQWIRQHRQSLIRGGKKL